MEQIVKLTNQTTPNGAIFTEGNIEAAKGQTKFSAQMPTKNSTRSEPGPITSELLDAFLYGKRKTQGIDLEAAKRQKMAKDSHEKKWDKADKSLSAWCETCRTQHAGTCHERKPLKVLRQLVGNTVHDIQLTYAVLSFPSEVQLCTSSIPGYNYGVSAKQPFPIGTWIGPYEGKRIKSEEITATTDSNYVWEIYEDGKFSHYLDGNDENSSSWMRFIRCARHKGEQNMVVFQYGNNIYYRAVRDIPAGTELLVWYNNNYTQFLGVPTGLREVPGTKKGQENNSSGRQPCKAQSSPVQQTDRKPDLKELNHEINNHKAVHNKIPETVHGSRLMQTTTTTFCYSSSSPSILPQSIKYFNEVPAKNLNMVQPTVTIEHRPTGTDGAISQNHKISPGNSPRQHYVTPFTGTSPITSNQSDQNNNCFIPSSSSPPTSSQSTATSSTTAVSLFQDDSGNDSGQTWKCSQCLKTFNQRLLWQMHMCVKPPERPYQCGHCSDSFSQPSELRSHVVTHSNDRPFKCGFCGRAFAGATTLNNHMRTHTGERPFLCNNCGRTFSIATQLSRHMRTPGECPMIGNMSEIRSDAPPPFTSTLTRG